MTKFAAGFFFLIMIVSCSQQSDPRMFYKAPIGDIQDPEQPCKYIHSTVMLRYVYENSFEGPYQVIDCLQHDEHWEKSIDRSELVEVRQYNISHWGIAKQGELWLNVLVWEENIRPYSLNLLKVTTPTATPTSTPSPTATSTLTPTPTLTSMPPTFTPSPTPEVDNVILNPYFEMGKDNWNFYTNGIGVFEIQNEAARVAISHIGSNTQLFQFDIPLDPNTQYMLTFRARSSTGNDLSLSLHKHGNPYTNYGLAYHRIELTSSWQPFIVDFQTVGFGSPVKDARFRFWFGSYATDFVEYWIDDVILYAVQ